VSELVTERRRRREEEDPERLHESDVIREEGQKIQEPDIN
jgi:hypothetical protein